jgi:polysaccharide biosynthesis transport protein
MQAQQTPSNRPILSHPSQESELANVVKVLYSLWERWLLIALVTALVLSAAGFYCFKATPLYRATALIEVARQEQNIIHTEDMTKQDLAQLDALNTVLQKSTRPVVLQRVIASAELAKQPSFSSVGGVKASETQILFQLAGQVHGVLRRNTRLIEITAEHPEPAVAQLLANQVAEQCIRQEIEDEAAATRTANVSLIDEAGRLKSKLENSERLLQEYREKKRAVSLEERQNIVVEGLGSVARLQQAAHAERMQLEVQKDQANAVGTNVDELLALPALRADATVAGLQIELAQREKMVSIYTTRYKEKHPKMIEARKQVVETSYSLRAAALAAKNSLDAAVEAAVSREKGMDRSLTQAQQQALDLGKLGVEYSTLQREVESDRAMYESVLRRLKETDVSKGIEKTYMSLIQPAGLPDLPFRPNRRLLLAAGLLMGLLLGGGLAFVLSLAEGSFQTVEEAEALFNLPVFGSVPWDAHANAGHPSLVEPQNPTSDLAESFRSLSATISMLSKEAKTQVMALTSALPGDGKTFIACNLAASLAERGKRTLLVDFDLRRASALAYFDLPIETPGISSCLKGQDSVERMVRETKVPNLSVLPPGPRMANPGVYVNRETVAQFLAPLLTRFDMIVFDTPPINLAADVLSILPHCTGAFLVVSAGQTKRTAVQRALAVMQQVGFKPSGLVVNRLAHRWGYYYSKHYKYKAKQNQKWTQRRGAVTEGI